MISPRSGVLHIGISLKPTLEKSHQILAMMSLVMAAALVFVYVGALFIASKVSRPLKDLETVVSHFSPRDMPGSFPEINGTMEVNSLAKGFSRMVGRLNILEHERQVTQTRMVNAERLAALGELAAGLTHEIRNPLDGMMECVRFMEDDLERSPRQKKYLPMVKEGLQRINEVMQQMLTFASSGQIASSDVCPSMDIFNSLELLLEGKLISKKVRLTWHRPGSCICLCDKHAALQTLLNLVLNAVEAVGDLSDPELVLDARCDTQWVYFGVEDNGPGVPDSHRDRIFEPFYTTKSMGKGTGLGLSISRHLIRAAGGEVELSGERKYFNGARFTVRIPRQYHEENGT